MCHFRRAGAWLPQDSPSEGHFQGRNSPSSPWPVTPNFSWRARAEVHLPIEYLTFTECNPTITTMTFFHSFKLCPTGRLTILDQPLKLLMKYLNAPQKITLRNFAWTLVPGTPGMHHPSPHLKPPFYPKVTPLRIIGPLLLVA